MADPWQPSQGEAQQRGDAAPDLTSDTRMTTQRRRGPVLSKAELRAQGAKAMAAATKPIVKLPTKLVRQCGRCGESAAVMVEPGEAPPPFKCKTCDKPARGE